MIQWGGWGERGPCGPLVVKRCGVAGGERCLCSCRAYKGGVSGAHQQQARYGCVHMVDACSMCLCCISVCHSPHIKHTPQYLHGLFRAASNVITIGYGVEPPLTTVDLVLIFVSMAFGASLWALMMGTTASLLQRKDAAATMYVQQLQLWKVWCGGEVVRF